ncbi:MAG: hypothetical protein WC959_05140 [Kiritimatiellales bacterium]
MSIRNTYKLYRIILLLSAAGCLSAQAAVTVSYDAAMPATNVLTSFVPAGTVNGLQWRDDTANVSRAVGQSFLAVSNAIMDSFSLMAVTSGGSLQSGAVNAPFTVIIYESSSETDLGTAISTQGGNYLSSAPGLGGQWITFDIEDINLTAGKYYTFTLMWDTPAKAGQSQTFGAATTSENYPNGRNWRKDGTANWAVANSGLADMAFVVQYGFPAKNVRLLIIGGN